MVPCGVTNPLGNKTGVVNYIQEKATEPTAKPLAYPATEVWKILSGTYGVGRTDASAIFKVRTRAALSEFFVCTDPAKFQSNDYTDYEKRGELPRNEGYVKIMMIGEYGENMPTAVGASSTTYFADYFYTNVVSNTGQRGVLFGGLCGLRRGCRLFVRVCEVARLRIRVRDVGSRLCFLPA